MKDWPENGGSVLVTGGAGFIGSNFIRHLLTAYPEIRVTNLDALTDTGNLNNLSDIATREDLRRRYRFLRGDIAENGTAMQVLSQGFDAIVNFAAESHVDRSIEAPEIFLRTNYFGTYMMLEAARKHGVRRFLQISTDEVYGSASDSVIFGEDAPLNPSSPYSASKAAADLLALSYRTTFGVPVLIVRCSNNYGPYQFPEKLIPLMIANAMQGESLPVYGDGLFVRDWIYVEDCCNAIGQVLMNGRVGEIYNVGEVSPTTNLTVIKSILRLLNKPEHLISFVQDRPGHDRCYAVTSRKLRDELGWAPAISLDEGLRRTVNWYTDNVEWLTACRSGKYRDYYDRHYGRRSELLNGIQPCVS